MKDIHRPEVFLQHLRTTYLGRDSCCCWLRSTTIHGSFHDEVEPSSSSSCRSETTIITIDDREQHWNPGKPHSHTPLPIAIAHLTLEEVPNEMRRSVCIPLVQQLLHLTALDLRAVGDPREGISELLQAVVNKGAMRRLRLPYGCGLTHATLDRFSQLEELDVTGCDFFTSANFCAGTLRVLYAKGCMSLTDDGLCNATRLEVLHIGYCPLVTSLAPFAHSLVELNASFGCGIGDDALSGCHRLHALIASSSECITTLQPFAASLRELQASGLANRIRDAALVEVTGLVRLDIACNPHVTTVAPFGASLRHLCAWRGPRQGGLSDAGIATATNLVALNATGNGFITTVKPFAGSLLELNASSWRPFVGPSQSCGIGDEGLVDAHHLVFVDVFENPKVTTVAPFEKSLRYLHGMQRSSSSTGTSGY